MQSKSFASIEAQENQAFINKAFVSLILASGIPLSFFVYWLDTLNAKSHFFLTIPLLAIFFLIAGCLLINDSRSASDDAKKACLKIVSIIPPLIVGIAAITVITVTGKANQPVDTLYGITVGKVFDKNALSQHAYILSTDEDYSDLNYISYPVLKSSPFTNIKHQPEGRVRYRIENDKEPSLTLYVFANKDNVVTGLVGLVDNVDNLENETIVDEIRKALFDRYGKHTPISEGDVSDGERYIAVSKSNDFINAAKVTLIDTTRLRVEKFEDTSPKEGAIQSITNRAVTLVGK